MSIEKRFLPQATARTRIERRGDGSGVRITGYGAVFYKRGDPETEFPLLEDLVERIMPGAFDRSLREKADVRSLFNHNADFVLGRTAAGTLRLTTDSRGLRYEIDAPDTDLVRDLVISPIERGDVDGSSFMFIPVDARWHREGGVDVREIHDVELIEAGPVTFPAYAGTTSGVEGGRGSRGRNLTTPPPAAPRRRQASGCRACRTIGPKLDRAEERVRRLEADRDRRRADRRRNGINKRLEMVDRLERDKGPPPKRPSRRAVRKRLRYVAQMERA